jgi:hypothetical protein
MEKNLRLRVEVRKVNYDPTFRVNSFSVNCWRLTIIYGAFAPVLNGVDFGVTLTTGIPGNDRMIKLGGVYDKHGTPVYLNQSFIIASGAAAPANSGLVLIEEYLDHNARQNR